MLLLLTKVFWETWSALELILVLIFVGKNTVGKYSNYLKSRQIKRRYKFKNILLVLSAVIPSKKKQGNHSVNEAKNLRYVK